MSRAVTERKCSSGAVMSSSPAVIRFESRFDDLSKEIAGPEPVGGRLWRWRTVRLKLPAVLVKLGTPPARLREYLQGGWRTHLPSALKRLVDQSVVVEVRNDYPAIGGFGSRAGNLSRAFVTSRAISALSRLRLNQGEQGALAKNWGAGPGGWLPWDNNGGSASGGGRTPLSHASDGFLAATVFGVVAVKEFTLPVIPSGTSWCVKVSNTVTAEERCPWWWFSSVGLP